MGTEDLEASMKLTAMYLGILILAFIGNFNLTVQFASQVAMIYWLGKVLIRG